MSAPWLPGEVKAYYDFLAHPPGSWTEMRLIDPRGHLRPQVIWVQDKAAFVRTCEMFNGQYQIYAGINPRKHRTTHAYGGSNDDVLQIQTLPIDIDALHPKEHPATLEELHDAYMIALGVMDFIRDHWADAHPVMACSGNGYQVLVPIEPIVLGEDMTIQDATVALEAFWKVLRWHVYGEPMSPEHWTEIELVSPIPYPDAEMGIVDSTFDPARIFRVIGTLNIKGTEVWGDVDEDVRPHRVSAFEVSSLSEVVRKPSTALREYIMGPMLKYGRSLHKASVSDARPVRTGRSYTGYDAMRPCFRRAIEDGVSMTGEEGHAFRVALVAEANAEGMTEAEICSLFSGQGDYDAKKTAYYVRHAIRAGYTPWTCATLQARAYSIVSRYCMDCPIAKGKRRR